MKRLFVSPWIAVSLIVATIASSPFIAKAVDEPAPLTLPEVARADDGAWRVESMGQDVYLFRWRSGLYVSVFVVGEDGVLATDPINQVAAAAYRQAIASVTKTPVTKIVYSHDHRDHIVGADVLAPAAEIIAHPAAQARIRERGDADIRPPTRLVDNGDIIAVGKRTVGVHYFGPNHSDSNIGLTFATDHGTMLMFVDTMEIGIVPFRTLPDTDIGGYIATLTAAAALKPDLVLGGHSGPGPGVWVDNYLSYFLDMKASCVRAMAMPDPAPTDVPTTANAVIAAGEKRTDTLIRRVMDDLRPKYGSWIGFETWAPLNLQTMIMYLTIGN